MTPALILPGLGNSGPGHWQSLWEAGDTACRRVYQDEWDAPSCADWVSRLAATLDVATEPVVLVAHSAACALVAHWASRRDAALAKVRGALLVAPSDPTGPNYPPGPTGFAPVPRARLPFPAVVVASSNDPYVAAEVARGFAADWGAELVMLAGAGHINVASGHGPWPEGFALLERLRSAR